MKFAVIGTNTISELFMNSAMQTDSFELGAVLSRNEDTGRQFAQKYGEAIIYTDISALAQNPDIEAVYIASPNSLHAPQAITLLNAGKHVLGEKPSALCIDELNQIISAAQNNKRCYMEALLSTHLPNYKLLQKHLERIGTPRKYIGQYCQFSSRYQQLKEGSSVANVFKPEFGGGSMLDLGIYPLYPLINLWGMPKNIQAQSVMLPTGVDGATDVLMDYGDKQAVVSCSKMSNGHNYSEFQGEKGRLCIHFVSLMSEITLHLNDGTSEVISTKQDEYFMKHELEHFIQIANADLCESPTNSWELSRDVLSVMDTVREQCGIRFPSR